MYILRPLLLSLSLFLSSVSASSLPPAAGTGASPVPVRTERTGENAAVRSSRIIRRGTPVNALPPDSLLPAPAETAVPDTLSADTLDAFSPAADEPLETVLARRLDQLLQNDIFQRTQVGLYVYDLTSGQPVYAHNERQLYRPASNQKVITAISALSLLGTDYNFRTSLCMDGEVVGDTLRGNLYIRAGFDPLFDRDDLRAFVQALEERGIAHISGQVCFDRTMKTSAPLGWGWCWDDDYGPLTPLLYNGKDRFEETWERLLAERGIETLYRNGESPVPAGARIISERTHTLLQVMQKMMKESDNLFAEAVFYQLAARQRPSGADHKDAARLIHSLITRLGHDPKHYQIADGSGLSLYNYTTAELLVSFLRYAYSDSELYHHFLETLPVAGIDGTLRKRMRGGTAFRNVAAKTGTVEGVSTLSGYLTAANGHRYCFAILNQGLRYGSTGRNFQDRFCQALTAP